MSCDDLRCGGVRPKSALTDWKLSREFPGVHKFVSLRPSIAHAKLVARTMLSRRPFSRRRIQSRTAPRTKIRIRSLENEEPGSPDHPCGRPHESSEDAG